MAGSRPRVLLVEDNREIREALEEILDGEGYAITAVGTAERGLDELGRERFDLVVSDYGLPGHTGAWMLGQAVLAGRLEEGRALLVTAHPEPNSRGFKVMAKPLDFDRFLGELAGMLQA